MKCKVMLTELDTALSNYHLVEDTINIWLKQNPQIKILFINQAGLGTRSVVTTIFYE